MRRVSEHIEKGGSKTVSKCVLKHTNFKVVTFLFSIIKAYELLKIILHKILYNSHNNHSITPLGITSLNYILSKDNGLF